MKHLIKTSILTLTIMVSSCDLLEVDAVSDIISNDYWKSKGDVEAYINGIYTSLRNTANSSALYHYEDRGDCFVRGLTGGPSSAWSHDLTPEQGVSWSGFYTVIQHCNNLIKNINQVPFASLEEKNKYMADAYFVRAYMYFCVVRSFGDAPLELEPTEDGKKPKLHRSTAKEVMSRVLEDVDLAITMFGADGFPKGKGKASRPACYALKADALLWNYKVLKSGNEEDLKAVISNADLASKGTSLDDFENIHSTKKGKEVIFALHFKFLEQVGQYSNQLKPKESHVSNAANKNDIAWAKTAAGTTYRVSPETVAIFDNPLDIRKNLSIIHAVDTKGNSIGWFDNKMRGLESAGDRAYDNDIVVYRHAEMILMKAEAYAALDQIPEAVTELNLVRNRAKTGNYTGALSKMDVEKEILDERFRELYLEMKRWPDLVRFHFGQTIDVYDVVPNLENKRGMPLFFPIPRKDIDLNPNLKQTEGYPFVSPQ